MHLIPTLAIFLLTLLLLFLRPHGLHESWATTFGGALMLLLGLVTWREAWQMVVQAREVLFFLFTLMLLSALLDRSGFFEWAAIHAARLANGNGVTLYRNVFLLGAVITAFLSLDTTAIILTPIVLAFVGRLKLDARPFLFACAFVANTASLLLPVSNLTNLLFAQAFHLPFEAFALQMALPQLVVLGVNYLLFRGWFRNQIPKEFDRKELPEPKSVLPDLPFFYGALLVLVFVFFGYFIGSLRGVPPYQIALVGCGVLVAWAMLRKQADRRVLREVSWSLFPFVIGLFMVVRGVENLGIASLAARGLRGAGNGALPQILATAFGGGVGSNIVNNIPMALLSIPVLDKAHLLPAAQYGALLGCNLGPNLAVTGSLATMLVITGARKKGEAIDAWEFFKIGVLVTPFLLLTAALALWLTSSR